MNPGDTFTIAYPFVRSTWDDHATGEWEDTWRPGTDERFIDAEGNSAPFADAEGKCTFTVVSVHKPGKYPERVFYTQAFTDPDGHEFSNGRLRCRARSYFRRLTSGFLSPYAVATEEGEP